MSANRSPSENDVTLFCDIAANLSRSEAVARLKANNNDLQRAVQEYFESPNSTKYKWDESHFGADREGEFNSTSVSFNIQGPDELAPASYHGSTAPTRPPSRTNNRSPLIEGAPTNHAEEDAALQQALAQSAAESGLPPQETGVVDTSSTAPYFGPATRPEYESSQWAMVPTKASTESANTDRKPSLRKRQPGTPAFLRQTKDCRLGSLMSIYHKIALVRNIFLSHPGSARTYGHNSEWWKGQPILKPEVLETMMREETVPGMDGRPVFGEELHRLMAFLDKTDRSYGTVDSLIETEPIDPPDQNNWSVDYESRFLDYLAEAKQQFSPEYDTTPMVSIGKVITASSMTNEADGGEVADDYEASESEQNPVNFALLDITLNYEQWSWVNTLYDALDELLWTQAESADQPSPETSTAILVRPAEVITIRFNGAGLHKSCDIPAIFYADRYMENRQDLARHFQRQIYEIRTNGLQRLKRWEDHRVMCKGEPGCSKFVWLGQSHDVRTCRKKIIETFEILIDQQRKNAQWRHFEDQWEKDIPYSMSDLRLISTWSGPYELTAEEESKQRKWAHIVQAARDELEQLDRDMAVCTEKREEFVEMLEVISKRLTCQEHEADDARYVYRSNPEVYHPEYWNPSQKYSLRGVALTNELTYVCVREEPDLIDMGEEPKPIDQWWKLEYSLNNSSPATVEKTSLDDVLHAAGTGSKWPLLVYATEKAVEAAPIPLSDPLRMFVKADNRSFQQELAQEQNQEQVPKEPTPPPAAITDDTLSRIPGASPAKRKHSTSSSVATNGSSQGGLDDVDLTFSDDHDTFIGDLEPTTSHQEYVKSSPQSNTLGDITESLANCRTNENESPNRRLSIQMSATNEGPEVEMQETTVLSRAPEMQERAGGPAPFFNARAVDSTPGGTVDLMDMDIDSDHPGSQS